MKGPDILVRSLSQPGKPDRYGNSWQYHSRSDRHSKIACWGVLYDLLEVCALLRSHVERGAVGFGINHLMRDFRTGRKKDLDLVICTPGSGHAKSKTFRELVDDYQIILNEDERRQLDRYPDLTRVSVGSVHLALEAKACMTAHIKALPRLYDELNSSHLAIHGSSDYAIAAGFTMVNLADRFVSADLNKFDLDKYPPQVSENRQPDYCLRAVEKIREIPRRSQTGNEGFDALGIVVVDCRNDHSPVKLVSKSPAPSMDEIFHYDQLIRRIAHIYESRFANI